MTSDIWKDYLLALKRCSRMTKLAAYHTRECAIHCERASHHTGLTAYYVNEALSLAPEGGDLVETCCSPASI